MFSPADHCFMARALELASQGLYSTAPNPRVGCVLVKEGQIVGEGYHQRAGEAHAEINAIHAAGQKTREATAYVTLEPCSHVGRTPPCTEALIQAGISKLICAMADPNPKVAGGGFERLRTAGITTQCGLMQHEAEELNIGFISRMSRKRPWIRSKLAASLDGKTALNNGQSQWITGSLARNDGHHWRARACAILSGIGTIHSDNPHLNVRHVDTPRQPAKIIIDSKLEIPLAANVLKEGQALLVTASEDKAKIAALESLGAEILCLADQDGKVDLTALAFELGRREINELHVEAGARLNGALLEARLVDELLIYLAPSILGNHARGMFEMTELASLDQKTTLSIQSIQTIAPDIRILARVKP